MVLVFVAAVAAGICNTSRLLFGNGCNSGFSIWLSWMSFEQGSTTNTTGSDIWGWNGLLSLLFTWHAVSNLSLLARYETLRETPKHMKDTPGCASPKNWYIICSNLSQTNQQCLLLPLKEHQFHPRFDATPHLATPHLAGITPTYRQWAVNPPSLAISVAARWHFDTPWSREGGP